MPEIWLSVVTPSYNQAEFIEQNIQQVFEQANENIEHIVIDGGSDDGTVDILREYQNRYNLRWVSESDRGQTHAINKGVKMATGKWVGWQNSDDYYLSGAFDTLRQQEKDNPSADAVYGDLDIVNENGQRIARKFTTRPSKFIQRHWSLFASNQSLFVRNSVVEDIFPLNEDIEYTMDAELTWKLLPKRYNLVHVSEPLGAFRIQADAKTYQDVRKLQDEELRTIYGTTRYEKIIPEFILENSAKVVKAVYLILDGNYKAIVQNFRKRMT